MTPTIACTECIGIEKNPTHYCGETINDAAKLRCVLYEAFTLAITVQALRHEQWRGDLCYPVPTDEFNPSEVLKSAALIKIRLLHDFLYTDKHDDDFTLCRDFKKYGFAQPLTEPKFVGLDGGEMFTRKSINKFVAHLTKQRITKPKCIPQPKFQEGKEATITNSILILRDMGKVATKIINNTQFVPPAIKPEWFYAYLDGFRTALSRLP